MKPLSLLSDSSLAFHREEAAAAVSAHPMGHKAKQYIAEAHACEDELRRREMLREARATVARSACDPLAKVGRSSRRARLGSGPRTRSVWQHRHQIRADFRFWVSRVWLYQTARP